MQRVHPDIIVNSGIVENSEQAAGNSIMTKVFRVKSYLNFDKFVFLNNLNLMLDFVEEDGLNVSEIRDRLKLMVSTYHPKEEN